MTSVTIYVAYFMNSEYGTGMLGSATGSSVRAALQNGKKKFVEMLQPPDRAETSSPMRTLERCIVICTDKAAKSTDWKTVRSGDNEGDVAIHVRKITVSVE